MAYKGYINDFYKQFEELNTKLDRANNTIFGMSLTISSQGNYINNLLKQLEVSNKNNQELLLEIERLKNKNNKDSSNSSKPSSTNGFKKVITNNREKSTRKKGGQINHKGTTLTNKQIEEMINNKEIDEIITIEENKNDCNKTFQPLIRYEYDIKIKRVVTKYVLYPNKKTNITNCPVIYGNNIKIINCLLNQNYMSLDGIQKHIFDSTNNKILTSKGSLFSWNKQISDKLEKTEYEYIKNKLMDALVVNVDESPIKIGGEQYYLHNISDGYHTLQYVTKHRNQEDIDEFGFLNDYKGIIVHDHYTLYYNYGADNAECNVHILRYLNGVTEFTNHEWAKKLKSWFLKMKDKKDELIQQGKEKIDNKDFKYFKQEYLKILDNGIAERKQDLSTNSYQKEEINLLNRLIKYCNNHLLFLKKFFVPFSNNRAESDLRGIKIKQKIGKFRSLEGAQAYAIIKSCISTYKKNNVNLYYALMCLLENKPILI